MCNACQEAQASNHRDFFSDSSGRRNIQQVCTDAVVQRRLVHLPSLIGEWHGPAMLDVVDVVQVIGCIKTVQVRQCPEVIAVESNPKQSRDGYCAECKVLPGEKLLRLTF